MGDYVIYVAIAAIIYPGILQAEEFCPGMGLDFVCSNSTPNGAWVSNVTYNPPDDNGEIFFTWAPDPQIPQEDRGYRLFIRNLDSGTSQYMTSPSRSITRNTLSSSTLSELESNTLYEVLICHDGVSMNLIRSSPEFFDRCGFCRTCFRTTESVIVQITTATHTDVNGSPMVAGDIFVCQTTGNPLPMITWTAMNMDMDIVEPVTDSSSGININNIIINGTEVISELRLFRSGVFRRPSCTASNGLSSETIERMDFDHIGSVTITDNTDSMNKTTTSDEHMENTVTFPIYGVVILIVSPLVFVIPVCFISIAFYIRCSRLTKKKKRQHATQKDDTSLGLSLSMGINDSSFDTRKQSIVSTVHILNKKIPEDMIIPPSALDVSSVIGQGEFGVIYKALWTTKEKTTRMVAVKTLKGIFATGSDIENATQEILKMRHFDHINVMPMLGVCFSPSNNDDSSAGPSLVMPFMEKGSLLDYIRKEADRLFTSTEDEARVVRNQLIQMCMQISRGMEYLASLKFIHRDLAARNCLMDLNGTIKVSDFGLTENLYSRNYFRQVKEGEKLPLKWMALESIKLGVFTEKTDVWSFGITCWEIYSGGAIPYPGTHPQEVFDYLEEGDRLTKPKNTACSADMYALLLSCWESKSESRPRFSEIVCTLENHLMNNSGYIDLRALKTSVSEDDIQNEDDVIENQIHATLNDYCIAGI